MPLLKAVSVFKEVDSLERKRAEMLYVFAILSAKSGYCHIAKGAAEECILLLRKIGADTMEECATQTVSIEGVTLPEFLHEGVVRERLGMYGILLS